LSAQIKTCQTASTSFLHAGDKEKSLAFQKEMKIFASDLEMIKSIRAEGGPTPQFHSETKTYSIVNQQTDLQENEMEIRIEKGLDIPIPAGYTSVDTYVNYEVELPETPIQTGYTNTIKNTTDPDYAFSTKILIQRGKSFTKWVEKKKISFELMHNRGFLRKAVSIGKAGLELAGLTNKCEIHEVIEVLNERKKPTGAKLEVKARLRNPTVGSETVTNSEKWYYIDHFGSVAAPASLLPAIIPPPAAKQDPHHSKEKSGTARASPNKPQTQATASPKPVQPAVAGKTAAVQGQAQAPATAAKPTQPVVAGKTPTPASVAAPTPAAKQDEEDEEDYDPVDTIVSNNVLEWEQKTIKGKIEAYEAKKQPVPEELTDRLQQVEIKMSVLVLSVQTGQLTVEVYLETLKKAITTEKQRALKFKKENKINAAKCALNRMKIMEEEVENIKKSAENPPSE
jgi:hypothetical protein